MIGRYLLVVFAIVACNSVAATESPRAHGDTQFHIDQDAALAEALRVLEEAGGVAAWSKRWDLKNPQFAAIAIKADEANECTPAGHYVFVAFPSRKEPQYPRITVFEISSGTWKRASGGAGLSLPSMIERLREGALFCD